MVKTDIKIRLESKFMPVPYLGCWVWIGALNNQGYGVIGEDGKNKLAHRASYEIYKGEIPDGLCVCHTCDNRFCVNPDHLWTGTQKENTQDKMDKGRYGPKRIGSPRSKVDKTLVKIMREAHALGYPVRDMANYIGITMQYTREIINRKWWKHIE